jgi:hypothetical protein
MIILLRYGMGLPHHRLARVQDNLALGPWVLAS